MCGFVGIWFPHGGGPSKARMQRAVRSLAHRGPDEERLLFGPSHALGFRRLQVLDPSGSSQPLESEGLQLVVNGEIYNYRELRAAHPDFPYRTEGDSESILALYRARGDDFLAELRGMFALALFDAPRRRWILARDRLGQKPLYYARRHDCLAFASELSALLLVLGERPRINQGALAAYLKYGVVPAPASIFEGIHKLPPAHLLEVGAGWQRLERYWLPPLPGSLHVSSEELEAELQTAVRLRLRSDVPLGSFLSGGLDSALIASFLPAGSRSFCVGFADSGHDESSEALASARALRLEHTQLDAGPPLALLNGVVQALDEPLADSSCLPSYALCRAVSGEVRVALSGDGADELFGGYRRHAFAGLIQAWARLPLFLRGGLLRQLRRASKSTDGYYGASLRGLTERLDHLAGRVAQEPDLQPEFFSFAELHADFGLEVPVELTPAPLLADLPEAGLLERLLQADAFFLLPGDILTKVDRMSMAHGLEVRCPFLDHYVASLALGMPSSDKVGFFQGKRCLRQVARRRLPAAVVRRPKHGFAAPLAAWLRGPLREPLQELLLAPPLGLPAAALQGLWQRFLRREADAAGPLYAILILGLWWAKMDALPV